MKEKSITNKKMKNYFLRKWFFPFISLGLLFSVCLILKILSYPIIFLAIGFYLAAIRSLYKECRLLKRVKELEKEAEKGKELREKAEQLRKQVEPKHWGDMIWTYAFNYFIILSLIYIIIGYYLKFVNIGRTVFACAILFGLGFFVDDVFHRFINIFRL